MENYSVDNRVKKVTYKKGELQEESYLGKFVHVDKDIQFRGFRFKPGGKSLYENWKLIGLIDTVTISYLYRNFEWGLDKCIVEDVEDSPLKDVYEKHLERLEKEEEVRREKPLEKVRAHLMDNLASILPEINLGQSAVSTVQSSRILEKENQIQIDFYKNYSIGYDSLGRFLEEAGKAGTSLKARHVSCSAIQDWQTVLRITIYFD